jgi:hypothetical protein
MANVATSFNAANAGNGARCIAEEHKHCGMPLIDNPRLNWQLHQRLQAQQDR